MLIGQNLVISMERCEVRRSEDVLLCIFEALSCSELASSPVDEEGSSSFRLPNCSTQHLEDETRYF
jgi:hypothetical protein